MNVLMIGGNKGLGESLTRELMARGHHVRCLTRSNHGFDLADPNVENLRWEVQNALRDFPRLHALVVSSGMGAYTRPTVGYDEVERMFRVNTLGPMAVFRECQRALLKTRGKAMFVTSTCARRPGSGGLSYYAATKGAVHSWVISEGRRQAKKGVGLFALSPGWFDSPMTAELVPAVRAANERAVPFGRFGTVNEIAYFGAGLLEQSNWVVAGQVFEAAGGA